jgi:hypothetical protein
MSTRLRDYDYLLPPELIAERPLPERQETEAELSRPATGELAPVPVPVPVPAPAPAA